LQVLRSGCSWWATSGSNQSLMALRLRCGFTPHYPPPPVEIVDVIVRRYANSCWTRTSFAGLFKFATFASVQGETNGATIQAKSFLMKWETA
jgi:hypothetical protein